MRYRKLTESGDYTLGHGLADFYIDQPEAVAQAISTRLKLFQGEWFLDSSAGVPYYTEVLGENTRSTYDDAIRSAILETQGVTDILSYNSTPGDSRSLLITATVSTQYGSIDIQQVV